MPKDVPSLHGRYLTTRELFVALVVIMLEFCQQAALSNSQYLHSRGKRVCPIGNISAGIAFQCASLGGYDVAS